jgi:hypothetical protein
MLDTVVAMPDVVVAIATAKKLTEKGLSLNRQQANTKSALTFYATDRYSKLFT